MLNRNKVWSYLRTIIRHQCISIYLSGVQKRNFAILCMNVCLMHTFACLHMHASCLYECVVVAHIHICMPFFVCAKWSKLHSFFIDPWGSHIAMIVLQVHRACIEREIISLLDHPFLPTLYTSFQVFQFYNTNFSLFNSDNLYRHFWMHLHMWVHK